MENASTGTHTRVRVEGHVLVAACDHLVLSKNEAVEIAGAVRGALKDDARKILLHFVSLETPSPHGVSQLARELMEVVRQKGQIVIVGHQTFEKCIREQGLDRLFGWSGSVEPVLLREGVLKRHATKSAMDVLNAGILAISRSMKELLAGGVAPGKPHLRQQGEFAARLEIAVALPLQSAPFVGSMYLAFSRQAYAQLAMKVRGVPVSELDPGYDTVGAALLPKILEGLRSELSDAAFGYREVAGSVLPSAEFAEVFGHLPPTAVVIPFESDSGPFCLILVAGARAPAQAA